MPILSTKLFIPPLRAKAVLRPRLVERMNDSLQRKLTLISAPAGFGKTTLIGEWITGCGRPVAWLSLDEGDRDPARFLTCLVAAIRTIETSIGEGVFALLQSPQPPSIPLILTALINELTTAIPTDFVLVLDDYHVIDAKPVDDMLHFLLEHLPFQMHLVIMTREDPQLPLARLRAQGQLTELRAKDLRFTRTEAAGFLNETMGLNLSPEHIDALGARTEGWIAGLQLAAISMQGHQDAAGFIQSFNGSHRFVLDYLVEEVLERQSESVQTFLLRTSILDRLCGPLCDAVLRDSSSSGQQTLKDLERANMFVVPMDNEQRWYRYHHLFADLLRQRMNQNSASSTTIERSVSVAELHKRASVWYEDNGLEIEAFNHAAAANDVDRAARLVEGNGIPLLYRGVVTPVLDWLKSLRKAFLDERPSLWVMYASALLIAGQPTGVERKLQAAEAALQDVLSDDKLDDKTKDLVGLIASTRATLATLAITDQSAGAERKLRAAEDALQGTEPDDKTHDLVGLIAPIRGVSANNQHHLETIILQARRALAYLHPHNLHVRSAAAWMLARAYQLQGNRADAEQAFIETIAISQMIEKNIITIVATIGLGNIQETNNQLNMANETYRRALQLVGDLPLPVACEAHLGLARILFEWNDLDAAERHALESIQLAKKLMNSDSIITCEEFLARLRLVKGDHAQRQDPLTQSLIEPLSERELKVLRLIAHGLSNQEIGDRLFLALSTVKGHNRNIFGKLGVERRTEAVARARELGLL